MLCSTPAGVRRRQLLMLASAGVITLTFGIV